MTIIFRFLWGAASVIAQAGTRDKESIMALVAWYCSLLSSELHVLSATFVRGEAQDKEARLLGDT